MEDMHKRLRKNQFHDKPKMQSEMRDKMRKQRFASLKKNRLKPGQKDPRLEVLSPEEQRLRDKKEDGVSKRGSIVPVYNDGAAPTET